MVLVLQPGADQQKTLEELIEAQHNPESPEYQRWLTPEEFGARFGVSDDDLRQVSGWLEQHGFEVEPPSPSRRFLVFSGSAGQVSEAFGTDMRQYSVGGERHIANATDPEIPLALANVVEGVASLHDFHSRPLHRPIGNPAAPAWTAGTGTHYVTPADFAAIYNLAPVYAASTDGTGQSIAVIGRTNINLSDVQLFRRQFGLPVNDPSIVLNGPDPGIVSQDEMGEAALDVQWAGATAPKANVQLVVSGSTRTSDGVALSAQYAVSKNLAPVITVSFGLCEAALGTAGNQFWHSLWQQAAAQGITVLVSSGDSGAAGCDGASSAKGTGGAAVNGLCSSPYSTCVGGTQFADTANPSLYWAATNSTGYRSALGYIPETVWNESGSVAGGSGLWSTGGGRSILYAKPSWQTGPGVPADGVRDVPDVSLTASAHDAYLVVMNGSIYAVAGTSAAAPALAGILGLVAQRSGARLGNANPAFYTLAAKQASGGSAVFHDITTGNNTVPGVAGAAAGTGYDLATGLGSVDAGQLVSHWGEGSTAASTFQLSAPATLTLSQGKSATVTIQATASGGFSSAITLSASGQPTGLTASFSPTSLAAGSGSSTLTLTATTAVTVASYNVVVSAKSGSITRTATIAVSVIPASCPVAINPATVSAVTAGASYSATVTTPKGCPWQASSGQSWIGITTGQSGTGPGTLQIKVAANPNAAARTGSVVIGSSALTVNQAAAPVTYSLAPASAQIGAAAGSGSFTVTVNSPTATWKAVSGSTWLTITSSASGTGSGVVAFAATANTSTAARTGTITVAGLVFKVTQSGRSCTYSLGSIGLASKPPVVVMSIPVLTGAGCTWTASSNATWLPVVNGASGAGNGTVTLNASANTTGAARTATVKVAGISLTVTQSAAK